MIIPEWHGTVTGIQSKNILMPMFIYSKAILTLGNSQVSDTRWAIFSGLRQLFLIPAENTRRYSRGFGLLAQS